MLALLFLLFVVVPLIELALLIQIGQLVGTLPTVALVVFTGMLGAYLARRQGLGVLAKVRSESAEGRLPAGQLVDGMLILIAGAVLMTPGVLTDLLGFFFLVPAGRALVKAYLARRFQRAVDRGDVTMRVGFGGLGGPGFGGGGRQGAREVRNVTPPDERPGAHGEGRAGDEGG